MSPDRALRDTGVVIVGAGAAGIAAARALHARKVPCLVLEASRRIGGRTHTDTTSFGLPVDLGAHWFHSPAANPLRALADNLAFPYSSVPMAEAWRGFHAPLSEVEAQHCALAVKDGFARIRAAGLAGSDVPADDCLEAGSRWAGVVDAAFTAKQGVAPAAGSSLDFARYHWEGPDLPVTGGYGTLLARLAFGLPLRLAAPVTAIEQLASGTLRVSGDWGSLRASGVIVTASTGVLASGMIRFSPALPPATLEAIAALPMGHGNKLVLALRRPVLGNLPPSLWMPADPPGEALELVLRPNGDDLVVAVASGGFGSELAAAGEAAFRAHVETALTGLFGHELRRELMPRALLANWDQELWIRGYVAAARPGAAGARDRLAAAVDGRLWFAGEACAVDWMGDVHGAWRSGQDAAVAAMHALGYPIETGETGDADVR